MEFHRAAKPLLIASSVFGLLPFVVRIRNDRARYARRSYDPLQMAKIALIAIGFVASASLRIVYFQEYFVVPDFVDSEVEKLSYHVTDFFVSYVPLITVLLTHASQFAYGAGMTEAMNRFADSEAALGRIGARPDYRWLRKLHLVGAATMVLSFGFRTHSFFSNRQEAASGVLILVEGIATAHTNSMLDLIVLQWTALVVALRLHLVALYGVVKRVKYERYWLPDDFKGRKSGGDPADIISTIGTLYDELATIAARINVSYSLPFLFFFPSGFLATILMIFLRSQSRGNPKYAFTLLDYFSRMVLCIVPCIITKRTCDALIRKIHSIHLPDEESEDAIDALTLQVHHQKMSFSVFDTFPLDGSLVYGILSALVTYTVILLQFNDLVDPN